MRTSNTKNSPKNKFQILTFLSILAIEIIVLVVFGYFLINKLFSPKAIARILPAENTLVLAEMNVDLDDDQWKKMLSSLEKYPVYKKENLQKLLSIYIPDLDELKPWVGRKIAITFIENPPLFSSNTSSKEMPKISPVLFVEFKNYDQALVYLKSKSLKAGNTDIDDQLIEDQLEEFKLFSFKFGQNYQVLLIDKYLIFSDNLQVLQQIVDVKKRRIPALSEDPLFTRASSSLPQTGVGFAYVNTQKNLKNLLRNKDFLNPQGQSLLSLLPFTRIFTAEAYALIFDNNQLKLYQTTLIDKKQLGNQPYLTFPEKYAGRLLRFLPAETTFFFSGHNLKKEYNKIFEIFSEGATASNLVFQAFIEEQKNLYFDKNIKIDQDILPLLEQEYFLSFSGSLKNPDWLAMLELKDPMNDKVRLNKLLESFTKKAGRFAPERQTFTLPDETKGEEMVATKVNIVENQSYRNSDYNIIEIGNAQLKLYYLFTEEHFVFTNNLKTLQSVIDNADLKGNVIADFLKDLNGSDELVSLAPKFLLDSPALNPYFEPVKNIVMGRNYFDDGIATTYIIYLK